MLSLLRTMWLTLCICICTQMHLSLSQVPMQYKTQLCWRRKGEPFYSHSFFVQSLFTHHLSSFDLSLMRSRLTSCGEYSIYFYTTITQTTNLILHYPFCPHTTICNLRLHTTTICKSLGSRLGRGRPRETLFGNMTVL